MATVIYNANGLTTAGNNISGQIAINVQPEVSSGITYDILWFHLSCNGSSYDSSGSNPGLIQFMPGPQPNTIVTSNGNWVIGQWNNGGPDGTGVWFKRVDGSIYSTSNTTEGAFGNINDYRYLPAWIELCADLVSGGPFTPVGHVRLIWNGILPQLTPSPPQNLKIN